MHTSPKKQTKLKMQSMNYRRKTRGITMKTGHKNKDEIKRD